MRLSLPRQPAGWWLAVVCAGVLVSYLFALVGLPSPALFGGLAVGLAVALTGKVSLDVPHPVGLTAFAVTGVITGQLLTLDVLGTVVADGLAVAAALVATLVLTVAGGFALAAVTGMDRPTGVFGTIAGGASGVVVVSAEAGADAGLVALMQYLRVLIVLASIPLVTSVVSDGGPDGGGVVPVDTGPIWQGLLFCAVACAVGAPLAKLLHIPSGALLGPMLLAAAVAIVRPDLVRPTPRLIQDAAFLVIGLQVGLRFSLAQVRLAVRSLPAVVVAIVAIGAGCALIGAGMAAWTGRPFFDCYLATTPGGLYAVLATAVQTGADAAYVTSVQVLRIFMMLLAAPALGWFVRRHQAGPS